MASKKATAKKASKRAAAGGGAKKVAKAKTAATGKAKSAANKDAPVPTMERGVAWVERITCPVQRALARAVPTVCDLFGIDDVAGLFVRVPAAKGDYRNAAANSFREMAIGVIALLGRDLGLSWSDLHARAKESGRTQVQYLYPAHRWSLFLFASRAAAVLGRGPDADGDQQGEPMGGIGWWLTDRYKHILASARQDAAQPRLPLAAAG